MDDSKTFTPTVDDAAAKDYFEQVTQEEEQEQIEELHHHAERVVQLAQQDPRQQLYFKRLDKGYVVKTEEEYQFCVQRHIPMTTINYGQAVACLHLERSDERKVVKRKQKRKTAKASRKRNRR